MTGPGRVGDSPARVGGLDRVTGRQAYVADIRLERTLYAKLVTVDVARARIISMSTSAALSVPGVRLVFTAADLRQAGAAVRTAVPRPPGHRRRRDALPRRARRDRCRRDPRRRRGSSGARPRRVRAAAAAVTIADALAPTPRSSRTRRFAPAIRWPPPTSFASTTTAGATWTWPPATPTSSSRAPTASRWSPSSPSSRTRSSRHRTAMAWRSGARSSTRTGSSGSSPASSGCRSRRCASSPPTRAAGSAASSTPSTSR